MIIWSELGESVELEGGVEREVTWDFGKKIE